MLAGALTGPCGRAAPASGEEPLHTVTVRAATVPAPEQGAPTGFVSVIDTDQYANRVESVADVLEDSVGVSVRRFGGLGSFSTLSIRGSSANEVQIYLDGVPLSRARNETVNLSDLPLDSLERIEVYRGTAPVFLGVAGIGGVVNLVTRPPSATPSSRATLSYGSFDTRKVVLAHSQQVRGVDLLAYVTYLGSTGNFTYETLNPQPGSPAGSTVDQTRRNNAFDSVDGLVKAGYTLAPGVRLEATSETFYKHQGVPGLGINQSLDASLTDLRALNYLRLTTTDWLAPGLDGAATLYGIYQQQQFFDPKGTIGTGPQDRDDETGLAGGTLHGTYYLGRTHALGWLTDVSFENYSPANHVAQAPNEPAERRLRTALSAQDQASLWGDRVLLVPTLRYERVHDDQTGTLQGFGRPPIPAQTRTDDLFSPAGGVQVALWPWLMLRGNLGQYERPPNFSELFGNSGSIVGNPTLKSERAVNRDVGFVATSSSLPYLDDARLEYAYFDNDIDDLIVLVQVSPSFATFTNVSGAHITGHELGSRATIARHLRIETNYTYQDAENRSQVYGGIYAGKQLPGRPKNELFVRLEAFDPRTRLYFEFNYLSGNYVDQANFREIPARETYTLGASVQPWSPLTLAVEARNITNNQISDVAGFPLPGRAFFGTVSVRF